MSFKVEVSVGAEGKEEVLIKVVYSYAKSLCRGQKTREEKGQGEIHEDFLFMTCKRVLQGKGRGYSAIVFLLAETFLVAIN